MAVVNRTIGCQGQLVVVRNKQLPRSRPSIVAGAREGVAAVAERDGDADQEAGGEGQGRAGRQGRAGGAAQAGDRGAGATAGDGAGQLRQVRQPGFSEKGVFLPWLGPYLMDMFGS